LAAKGVEETDVGMTVTDVGAERNASTCCSERKCEWRYRKKAREGNFLNLSQRENAVVPDEDVRKGQRRVMRKWLVTMKDRGMPLRALTQ